MHALTLFLAFAAALWGFALWSAVADVRATRPVPPAAPPPDAPAVAVIVPARNEAHQIGACLRSLLAQDWPRLRVVCVDDRSEDGTFAEASAIADPRLSVVHGRDLEPGWLGKNFANAQGVAHAGSAELLLFTDADTVHAPGALAAAVAMLQRTSAELLTIVGDTRAGSFWERALLPHVLANVVSAFPVRAVNDPQRALAIANGQYLLFRRTTYDAIGGHAAIRDRVADDLELARRVKGSGRRLVAALGRELYAVRMYTSFAQIWWGFVKNASAGAGGPWVALAGAALSVASVLPFFVLPVMVATGAWHAAPFALAALACALALSQRALLFARLFPVPLAFALFLPLSQLLFAGIVVHSAVRQLSGKGPLWKGRAYPHGR